jgi:hypothetical protein
MDKEKLRACLGNEPLAQAVRAKKEVDDMRHRLIDAVATMRSAGLADDAVAPAEGKLGEYQKISLEYGAFLESAFGVTWQDEEAIRRYLDCDCCDMGDAPGVPAP